MTGRFKRSVVFVSVFTFLHALVSTGTHLWSIERSMEVAYRGVPHTWLDSILAAVSTVLLTPVFALVFHLRFDLLRGIGAYLAVLANSLLWAIVAWWIVTALKRRAASAAA